MQKRYLAPSVKKAFDILSLVSSKRDGKGLNEISKDLNMAKSTVHGITSALEDIGALKRNATTKRYTLGFTLFELARHAYSQVELKDIALPFMEELMDLSQASVFLGVLNWEHLTIVEIVESRHELKITSPIGTTISLFAGAAGKVFLSDMDKIEVENLIRSKGIKKYTENSITDPNQYLQELSRVKEREVAIDDEEYIPGVRAVSSPIKNEEHLIAAIWVVGFKAILDDSKMDSLIENTKATALKISKEASKQSIWV